MKPSLKIANRNSGTKSKNPHARSLLAGGEKSADRLRLVRAWGKENKMNLEYLNAIRNEVVPYLGAVLLKTNYKGMGERDKTAFEQDFYELLDLAEEALRKREQKRVNTTNTM